jgi:hypothetical protein
MPDCTTCSHSNTLHGTYGCSVDGCACDELVLPEVAPDVEPPVPGVCLHLMTEGSLWVIEDMEEVEEKLEADPDFLKVTACDFEDVEGKPKKQYCTFPARVRPQAITSYHAFLSERWEHILKNI